EAVAVELDDVVEADGAHRHVDADRERFRGVDNPQDAPLQQMLHDVLDDGHKSGVVHADALEPHLLHGLQAGYVARPQPRLDQYVPDGDVHRLLFVRPQEAAPPGQLARHLLAGAAAEGEIDAGEKALAADEADDVQVPGRIGGWVRREGG